MKGLIAELKRRNVIRVGLFYVFTGWLILQTGDVLFELLQLPDWTLRLVLGVLILGLPIVLAFSWIFEITPEGIKLEKDVDRSRSITTDTGRKLNKATLVVAAIAIVLVGLQQWGVLKSDSPPAVAETIAGATDEPSDAPDVATPTSAEPVLDPLEPSVAVLPFVNMSPDPTQDYFADGLSDTLMHVLAQVRGLKVAARTSSFSFRGQNLKVEDIARELKVNTILEGSVQKAGDKVRVIAQLIEAEGGTHLWSANFDRDLTDIFAIQDEIAREVVVALKLQLLAEDDARLTQRYQPVMEAYEQLLLGRQELEKRTGESLGRAEQHYKRAIEIDPNYALAYVGLADTYDLQSNYANLSEADYRSLAAPLVERALALDPLSGEAYVSRAALVRDENPEEAERSFLQAIELSPSYPRSYHWYSGILDDQGRGEEALAMIRKASELDPLSPIIRRAHASILFNLGRDTEAIEMVRVGLERNPEFPNYYGAMAGFYWAMGDVAQARRWINGLFRNNPASPWAGIWDCMMQVEMLDDLPAAACLAQARTDVANVMLSGRLAVFYHRARGEFAEARAETLRQLESVPEGTRAQRVLRRNLGLLWAQSGDLERAAALLQPLYPDFFDGGRVTIEPSNWKVALWCAWLHQQTGDAEQAAALLDGVEALVVDAHPTRGLAVGPAQALVHSIRGQGVEALARLREAVDAGWRDEWRFTLRWDVRLSAAREEPGFADLYQAVEADMLAQLERYEQTKDDPLL